MSDLLIRGMEMPMGGYRTLEIAFDADGHPMALADGGDVFDVIPVPPHGRLGDLDKLDAQIEVLIERHLHGYTKSTWDFVCELRDILRRNPTILPASQPIDEDFCGEEYAEAKGFDNASAEDSMT